MSKNRNKHRHNRLPTTDVPRAMPPLPAGASFRNVTNPAVDPQAQAGSTVDVKQLNPQGNGRYPTFLPGTPVYATPGLDDGQGGPRQWGFPVGTNISPTVRGTELTPFDVLRGLARNSYAIGLCEDAHFRILSRLLPQVTPRDGIVPDGEDASDDKWLTPGRRMAEWFEEGPGHTPDGEDLQGWLTAVWRDLLELDAGVLYHQRTRGGYLAGLRYQAADTFQVLIGEDGRTPPAPLAAYRQVLYGAPGRAFSVDDIDYLRFVPRTDSPYGISPVERVLITVNESIRKQNQDLRRFTDGATPAGLIYTDNAAMANWSPEQLMDYERQFNAILAGNDALRMRVKALPSGWKFQVNDLAAITTDFDRWLLNIVVAAFGLTMDELAFTETSNRSVGDSQENVIYRQAVQPRAAFMARYFSRLIKRYDGTPLYPGAPSVSRAASPTKGKGTWDGRYQFKWGGIEKPEDYSAKVDQGVRLFQAGILSQLGAKKWLNLPIEQGEQDVPAFTMFNGGPEAVVVLDDLDELRKTQKALLDNKLQTAQVALQQQQMINENMRQQQEQAAQQQQMQAEQGDQSDQFGDEGQENGGDTGPDDNGPQGGPGGGAPAGQPPSPPTPTPQAVAGGKGAAPQQGTPPPAQSDEADTEEPDEDTGAASDDDAAALVDQLITQAKAKQSKTNRVIMPDMDETREAGGYIRLFNGRFGGRLPGPGRIAPPTVHADAGARDALTGMFGRHLADHEIAGLVGAQHGDTVRAYRNHATSVSLELEGTHGAYTAERRLSKDASGRLVMANTNIRVHQPGQGIGTHLFVHQADQLQRLGVSAITAHLARDGTHNGWLTWPRLGFDKDLSTTLNPPANDPPPTGTRYLSDLMRTPEGRAWWQRNGYGLDASFDLTPGSRSMQTLESYLREKGANTPAMRLMEIDDASDDALPARRDPLHPDDGPHPRGGRVPGAGHDALGPAGSRRDAGHPERGGGSDAAAGVGQLTGAHAGTDARAQAQGGDPSEEAREWRRYREVALKAVKRGKAVPAFQSAIIPADHLAAAAAHLAHCQTPHEVRAYFQFPTDYRCLVCGCGEPWNDHDLDEPTLQPDAPASAAPHTAVNQVQLGITMCPTCGHDAASVTETGYWYTGMVCPTCGHVFAVGDDTPPDPPAVDVLAELRALRADVLRAMGE